MGTVSEIQYRKQMTLEEVAKLYGESIDNLAIEILLEAIYNEKKVLDSPLNSK